MKCVLQTSIQSMSTQYCMTGENTVVTFTPRIKYNFTFVFHSRKVYVTFKNY